MGVGTIVHTTDTATLLNDDEVLTFVALDEVDCRAHARDAGPNDENSCIGMVFVTHWDFWPWFGARHLSEGLSGCKEVVLVL